MQVEIDEDRWMPASRASAIIREVDGIRFDVDTVLAAMAPEDKRSEKAIGGRRIMVRFVRFRHHARLQARVAKPKPQSLADRLTALEAQRAIDMRRIDQAIEALQKQFDRHNDFTTILTK